MWVHLTDRKQLCKSVQQTYPSVLQWQSAAVPVGDPHALTHAKEVRKCFHSNVGVSSIHQLKWTEVNELQSLKARWGRM